MFACSCVCLVTCVEGGRISICKKCREMNKKEQLGYRVGKLFARSRVLYIQHYTRSM